MKKNLPKTDAQRLSLKKIREIVEREQTNLRKEIADKILTLVTSAFGLVAALAWNDAIKGIFDHFFGSERDQLLAKIWYAVIITGLAVVITYYLSRFVSSKTGKKSSGKK